jgi:hypothetical protein
VISLATAQKRSTTIFNQKGTKIAAPQKKFNRPVLPVPVISNRIIICPVI